MLCTTPPGIHTFTVKDYDQPPVNCNQTSQFTGQERWPEKYAVTDINGTLVNISCFRDLPLASILRFLQKKKVLK